MPAVHLPPILAHPHRTRQQLQYRTVVLDTSRRPNHVRADRRETAKNRLKDQHFCHQYRKP